MSHLPKHLVIAWIQGSGKGTQAQKIVEKFWYVLFETGRQLREIAKEETDLGREIKSIMESGFLVSSRHLQSIIENFIKKNKGKKLLFDSPIRNQEQNKALKPILWDFTVIHLELDKEKAMDRLLGRRIDPETGEAFPADFIWDTNPKTGNKLIRRLDDTKKALKKRIEISIRDTIPIIKEWEKEWHPVYHINTDKPIDSIFAEIETILS